jgi:cytochrome P450
MGTYAAPGPLARFRTGIGLRVFVAIFHFFDRHPRALRALHACLRIKPVWRLGRTVLVTGDRQVADTLRRDDDFPLPGKRAAKFLAGPFILGMTKTPEFLRERASIEAALPPRDSDWVRRLAAAVSSEVIVKVATKDCFDVVEDLSTPVGEALIQEYFGVDEYAAGSGTVRLMDDLRLLGAVVASPDSELPENKTRAHQAANRVAAHMKAAVSQAEQDIRHGTHVGHDTVLRRIVHHYMGLDGTFDSDAACRNISGVLLPGTALVNRAFATGVVQILKHSSLHRQAKEAAEANNVDILTRCLMEALRFHPVFPIVPRYCPRSTTLPAFRSRYRIRGGRDVYVGVASAMFDVEGALFAARGSGYPSDAQLRDPQHYRHFGGGAHECPGQHVALAQMSAMLGQLLLLQPKLRRRFKPISYADDGLSPKSLEVAVTPLVSATPAPRPKPMVSDIPSRVPAAQAAGA